MKFPLLQWSMTTKIASGPTKLCLLMLRWSMSTKIASGPMKPCLLILRWSMSTKTASGPVKPCHPLVWWSMTTKTASGPVKPCLLLLWWFMSTKTANGPVKLGPPLVYSSQWEIKAVVRSYNEEHISIILSHETHTHMHTLRHTPLFSQSAYTDSKSRITWNNVTETVIRNNHCHQALFLGSNGSNTHTASSTK